jgi:hypothetical protein
VDSKRSIKINTIKYLLGGLQNTPFTNHEEN